jgi:hypothetical protein
MKNIVKYYELPIKLRQVQIVHVLDNGQFITDHKKFEKEYINLFTIDKKKIVNEIIRLRPLTQSSNKSVIFIKQNGEFYSEIDIPIIHDLPINLH